jgi:hypothetical protein
MLSIDRAVLLSASHRLLGFGRCLGDALRTGSAGVERGDEPAGRVSRRLALLMQGLYVMQHADRCYDGLADRNRRFNRLLEIIGDIFFRRRPGSVRGASTGLLDPRLQRAQQIADCSDKPCTAPVALRASYEGSALFRCGLECQANALNEGLGRNRGGPARR